MSAAAPTLELLLALTRSFGDNLGESIVAERQTFSTETPWENWAGYSRAVRVGNLVYVAGTTASNEAGDVQHLGSLYRQATYILQKIETALQAVGAEMRHVVRSRVYITRMADWQQVAQAHSEAFKDIRPANTLVEVSALATPDMLVEIEVDAVISSDQSSSGAATA